MIVSRENPDGLISDTEAFETLAAGLEQVDLAGKRVLVLIPDHTRSCPLPMMFRHICELVGSRAVKLDFLIALGTHQPMGPDRINRLVGITEGQRAGEFSKIGIYNHRWDLPDTFKRIGNISEEEIREISGGLMCESVPIEVNRMIFDYDQLMVCGPTSPHELVGFSGGVKYFFPGISGWDLINFSHWLGAVIMCINIIGRKHTPVREVINRAGRFIDVPIVSINMVAREGQLAGLYVGDSYEAYEAAAELSDKLHIVYEDQPYKTVLGIAPAMYDELWTAGKVMCRLEPIVADGGELIIYAPHITEISHTHGKLIDRIGYHVRDYFLKQMDKFQGVRRSVMAHCANVRGVGTFEHGVERPRMPLSIRTISAIVGTRVYFWSTTQTRHCTN